MDRAEIECRLTNQSLAPVHTLFLLHIVWITFLHLGYFL